MTSKILELRPEWSLLNPDFEGYKLSLADIPKATSQLQAPVDRVLPDPNHYSLLHARLYGFHNHLVGESSGDTASVYFADKAWKVKKVSLDPETNQLALTTVWEVPSKRERRAGDYNISMRLVSGKVAAVADGTGFLYVLDRGPQVETWTSVFCSEVVGPDQNFIIVDAVYKATEKEELHLLLMSVSQDETSEKNSTVIHWVTLSKDDAWHQVALARLTISGFVQYSQLEKNCEALYVGSDASCKFILDSEHEIIESAKEDGETKSKYTWTQNKDGVKIQFPLPGGTSKSLLGVRTEFNTIEVKYGEEVLLSGALYQRINAEATTWTYERNILEVSLSKFETESMWPEVVEGDTFGEYIVDGSMVEEAKATLSHLSSDVEVAPPMGTTFNSEEVEECDFENDKLTVFERLCRTSHDVTHRINLGPNQILLTANLDPDLPPAVGVRCDVDTCIWQPTNSNVDFRMEHRGTLLALGYIQASKQNRKFFVCAPDLSYCAIGESPRHIFIYYQNKPISSSELRNRVTGRRLRTLAQQQVVNLQSDEEIVGVYAANSILYVLGENFITALKLQL